MHLGFQVQVHDIREHADYRFAGPLLQPVEPRLQQGNIATKTVDDKTLNPRLFALGQQFQSADQVREDATAIDVGNQNHRAVHGLGKAHVGNVAGAQVDLGRRPGTFDHHHRVGRTQAVMGGQYGLHRDGFVIVIGHGVHAGHGSPVNDHLRAGVAVGLEQHRVHVGVRRQPGSLRLHSLRATDFAALGRHRAVERHVLRLERHHAHALTGQPAAQRCHQCTFARIGRGALHH